MKKKDRNLPAGRQVRVARTLNPICTEKYSGMPGFTVRLLPDLLFDLGWILQNLLTSFESMSFLYNFARWTEAAHDSMQSSEVKNCSL